ncbi:MAG: thioredoxin-disulfide reductase [Alphaproteobacteria bacterium]|uniref:Thioredoxin reductase n=1 Tax=PS1 clade bacterium TaxID=2175152 RepID=A0A368DRA5_9PROT|nr:thioredoxin-disulfide reductase [Rhodobiaceae bacterium]MBH21085.1 thioredoxin-disulfide reductase [Rhodobiaceae bacterium]OUT75329.1 MAG: thioredoxin-disulfide reductase [Rhizobiales bacterium TMED25]RCL73866.1 MAG: thioredoxin-disulfide reductase [PS1 clade bacterium]|tara:strand:- start:45520 stop:46455 length:936 start_codon:yes stop_codon:yes gene_type:complete
MEIKKSKVLIIGSGPAGYTAAIYASRAMLEPILIEGIQPGGQLTITTDVENYPGFADVIQGPWLMEQMKLQAKSTGVRVINDHINSCDLQDYPFKFYGESNTQYESDTLIICTGAQAKWLGLESEDKYKGFGVSACATCDGFFYKEKTVVVVGGGNTAVEEALFLTNFAKSVILVHRRDKLRCEKILEDRLQNNKKIRVIWDCVVEEISGSTNPNSVEGVNLKNIKTNAIEYLPTDGVFIAIGHQPSTQLFEKELDMSNGYILTTPNSTETSIKGVFAAGDVTDDKYRQAVTAAGMGCMAALDAEHYLANK